MAGYQKAHRVLGTLLPRVRGRTNSNARHNRGGDIAERLAAKAFAILTERGEIRSVAYVDEPGKDFSILLPCGCVIGIEVKRGEAGGKRHYRKYRDGRSVVLVTGGWSKQLTLDEAVQLIERVTDKTRQLLTHSSIEHRCA